MGENPIITGLGWDFGVYWNVGRAVLDGADVYAVFGSFYPPAATFLFAAFALLPLALSYGIWTVANIAFLAAGVGLRKAPVWLFYFPVVFVIAAGQIDLALFSLAALLPRKDWKSVAAAALITLKPQIAFLLLPFWLVTWLLRDRKRLATFVGATVILQGWPLLIDPSLFTRWIAKAALYGGGAERAVASPGLWSLPISGFAGTALIASSAACLVLVAIYASIRSDEWLTRSALLLATPTGHAYDGSLLAGAAPWLIIPISWIALIAAHAVGTFWPLALTTIIVFIWNAWRHYAAVPTKGIGKVARGAAKAPAPA